MAGTKKLTVEEALALYREKKENKQKISWSIFKKRMSTKDFPVFRSRAEALYGE